jgi:hypothetical protein
MIFFDGSSGIRVRYPDPEPKKPNTVIKIHLSRKQRRGTDPASTYRAGPSSSRDKRTAPPKYRQESFFCHLFFVSKLFYTTHGERGEGGGEPVCFFRECNIFRLNFSFKYRKHTKKIFFTPQRPSARGPKQQAAAAVKPGNNPHIPDHIQVLFF